MKGNLSRWLFLLAVAACGDGGDATPADASPSFDARQLPDAAPAPDVPGLADAGGLDAAPLTGDILTDLRAIPGLTVTERMTAPTGYRAFRLTFQQAVDHHQQGGPKFTQRLALLHRDYAAPVVLYTNGYMLDTASTARYEPTRLVTGNQLSVEHRFFGSSLPDPLDWTKLDIWQAASDHHAIIVALKGIYRENRWLSTGISKDGMTSIFLRRFYPDDIDGTVAYVAPLSLGGPDPRYVDFVEQTGVESCRQKLRDVQRIILSRRAALRSMMDALDTTFAILGPEVAFEHVTLEAPFGFWQYYGPTACAAIPTETTTNANLFSWLRTVGGLEAYGDDDIEGYAGYYYQAAHQLGWPEINEANVADLIEHPGTDGAPAYSPVPVAYDSSTMADVNNWVRTEGNRLLFIYGGYDPWTAGAYTLGNAADSFKYTVATGNHGSNIANLPQLERDAARATVRRWAGIPSTPAAKPIPEPPLEEIPLRRRPL